MVRPIELNSLALAYIGDAVYELSVRSFLLENGYVKPKQLHEKAVQFVSAPQQAKAIKTLLEQQFLTTEEEAVVRRGRNAKLTSAPRNVSVEDYRYSTGFEALVGYHYLNKTNERLDQIITKVLQLCNQASNE